MLLAAEMIAEWRVTTLSSTNLSLIWAMSPDYPNLSIVIHLQAATAAGNAIVRRLMSVLVREIIFLKFLIIVSSDQIKRIDS